MFHFTSQTLKRLALCAFIFVAPLDCRAMSDSERAIDFSQDGSVSLAEILRASSQVSALFGKSVEPYTAGDYDGNGFVNHADYGAIYSVAEASKLASEFQAALMIDVDLDGVVSLRELLAATGLVKRTFGRSVEPGREGDFTINGFVNFDDNRAIFKVAEALGLKALFESLVALDTSSNGELSEKELLAGYSLTLKNFGRSVPNGSKGDHDRNGFVNFTDLGVLHHIGLSVGISMLPDTMRTTP